MFQAIDVALEQVAVSEAYKLAQGENIGAVLQQAKNDTMRGIEMIVTALRAQADQFDKLGQKTEAIHKRKVAADVADLGLRADQLRDEGYAPLMRFGRYTVDVQRMVDVLRAHFS